MLGTFNAILTWKGRSTEEKIYVLPSQDPPLGFPAIQALGVVKFLDTVSDLDLQTPLRCTLFEGLGKLQEEYVIRLQPGAQPFALSVPRIPITLQEVVKVELAKLESDEVIRRVDTPTAWCSGVVVVPKPNGTYRLCVDLTRLNQVVLRERHVLPSVEQLLGQIGQAKVFSKLDATAGSHKIKLSE